jgi:DNA repair exonuclease SbcCD ATPase subunit
MCNIKKEEKMKTVMKYPLLVTSLVSALFLGSCKDKEVDDTAVKTEDSRYSELERNNRALGSSRDSMEALLAQTMDEIDKNLESIKEKEHIISKTDDSERGRSRKEKIVQDLAMINTLLEQNRQKVEELNEQLKKFGKEKRYLSKMAESAKKRVEEQENEIAALKEELTQGNYKIGDLNKQLNDLQMANMSLTEEREALKVERAKMDVELHKAYFTYGTAKELKDRKLIVKEGGFLGIGKKEALQNSFSKNKDYFTELDVRETTTIPVYAKKVKFVTFHPKDSYEIKTEDKDKVSYIHITKPDEFWSASKYLVVEAK